jgi:hypothetical protein
MAERAAAGCFVASSRVGSSISGRSDATTSPLRSLRAKAEPGEASWRLGPERTGVAAAAAAAAAPAGEE